MNDNFKVIEYVFVNPLSEEEPTVGMFQIQEIKSIIKLDNSFCLLSMKDGSIYKTYGSHRTLTNRYIYCLEKKREHYNDHIIRPSIMIYNGVQYMEVDNIHFDSKQLIAFITALKPELLTSQHVIDNIINH